MGFLGRPKKQTEVSNNINDIPVPQPPANMADYKGMYERLMKEYQDNKKSAQLPQQTPVQQVQEPQPVKVDEQKPKELSAKEKAIEYFKEHYAGSVHDTLQSDLLLAIYTELWIMNDKR